MKHTVQKLYPLFAFQQPHLPYFYKKSVLVNLSFFNSQVVYYYMWLFL